MSIFKNIFGNSSETKSNLKLNWKTLQDLGQLNEIVSLSEEKPVIIFKHSTTCSISRMVFKTFENEYNQNNNQEIYYLDLLNHRDISNEIASKFAVTHQSPQILVIKNGVSVYNASHENIHADDLIKFI
jgi:bacillithiol system protein YtxJ